MNRARVFRVWAALLVLGFGVGAFGLTTLVIGWFEEREGVAGPVTDLGYGALVGLIVTIGIATQLRAPERKIAGLQQACLAIPALAIGSALAADAQNLVPAAILIPTLGILLALHPARGEFVEKPAAISRALLRSQPSARSLSPPTRSTWEVKHATSEDRRITCSASPRWPLSPLRSSSSVCLPLRARADGGFRSGVRVPLPSYWGLPLLPSRVIPARRAVRGARRPSPEESCSWVSPSGRGATSECGRRAVKGSRPSPNPLRGFDTGSSTLPG